MLSGTAYRLPRPAPRTSAGGGGVWLGTPTRMDGKGLRRGPLWARGRRPSPQEAVALLPTPLASEATGGRTTKGRRRRAEGGLVKAAKLWPTPTVSDATGGPAYRKPPGRQGSFLLKEVAWRTPGVLDAQGPFRRERKTLGKRKPTDPQVNLADQVGGQLNPEWVEWLMGLPIGWTGSGPLATGSYRRWWRSSCGG